MPRYEFYCNDCKKSFSLTLSLEEYEKRKARCPRCGGKNLEQRWAAFYAVTSKKS